MTDWAIATDSLSKEYGDLVAVADLSLRVRRGEAYGFLGPNGAGKTTSLNMLVALVTPTSGQGTLLGKPIGDRRTRARIGLLPEHFSFHDTLTGHELLKFHGWLYGMNKRDLSAHIDGLLSRVGLSDAADRPLREYSKGMTQRLGIAQSILNRPEVVFWDEPTSALDPLGRLLVRDLIRELKDAGTTVFLNSHLLTEVEHVCERVAFVKQGRVIVEHDLAGLPATRHVEVRIDRDAQALTHELARFGRVVGIDGATATLAFASEAAVPELVRWLTTQNIDLHALQARRTSLEELFVDTIGAVEKPS